MNVSSGLFRLLTESVRLRSDALSQFLSVNLVVADLLRSELPRRPIDRESLADHLEAQPADGGIPLDLRLSATSSAAFTAWQQRLSRTLGHELSSEQALSGLLFTYIVECTVTVAMRSLDEQSRQSASGEAATDNVVRLAGRPARI